MSLNSKFTESVEYRQSIVDDCSPKQHQAEITTADNNYTNVTYSPTELLIKDRKQHENPAISSLLENFGAKLHLAALTSYFTAGKLAKSRVLSISVAISHRWGNVSPLDDVLNSTNRGKILISSATKLTAIKKFIAECSQPVWLDIYAINQDDHDEKCAQVEIMPDIYSLAESVCVFLAPEYNTLLA
ncbi:hypothetical protein HK100_008195 [Physocladia obscura]|uniref:Heterokaryon incompatibility domain-containing protein n=1 Tax=Physocladia obscura TaxID=109957 RepID=A0AAD5T4D8_9FUNG|nr:hypothetical protein HK100_008195 [Physocladia obscura]